MSLTVVRPWIAVIAMLLAACASAPLPPRLLQAYQRDMRLGQEFTQQGRLQEARSAYGRALVRARLDDDPQRLANALIALADSELSLDLNPSACPRFVEAEREARQLIASEVGRVHWLARLGQAECAQRAEQPAQVQALLASLSAGDALAAVAPEDGASLQVYRLNQLALAELKLGQLAAAQANLASALELARPLVGTAPLAACLANRALIRHAAGDGVAAVADAEAALALDRQRHDPSAIAESHALLARLLTGVKAEQAAYHRQRAVEIFILTGQGQRAQRLLQVP